MTGPRDHGGGIDAAALRHGGARQDWIDLSTGINPEPYPVGDIPAEAWTALPDTAATQDFIAAARAAWSVPEAASVIPAPGASALIARLPEIAPPGPVRIPGPTYNEHAASFARERREITDAPDAPVAVLVNPNNPDGRLWTANDLVAPGRRLTVVDESFCDLLPERSLIAATARPGTVVLKSFGKFWGLAGLRLGAAIGHPESLADLGERLGPWPVSGPALRIGARALRDTAWSKATRARLSADAARLDAGLTAAGAEVAGGTALYRLYRVASARELQNRLAERHIWTRIFPWSDEHVRIGLPPGPGWPRLDAALERLERRAAPPPRAE